jgi:hypothetical protein
VTGFLSAGSVALGAGSVTLSAASVALSAAKGLALLAVRGSLLAAVTLSAAKGQRYVESSRVTVTTQSGMSESGRFIVRDLELEASRRADTLVMQSVATRLEETTDGRTVSHTTDGFTGGRWKMLADTAGVWRVVARPFVPEVLREVSDLAAAMDDFFPTPPTLVADSRLRTDDGVSWQRLADSAGHARYRWEGDRSVDEDRLVADSVPMRVRETRREAGSAVADGRGWVAWQRRIDSESRTTLRGLAILGVVEHRITVERQD